MTRLLAILDIVATSGPASAAEIAQRMDLPFSTVARLTRQLGAEGLLNRDEASGRYIIGWRIFDLASSQGSVDLSVAALPAMTALRDKTGETVSLHVRRGDQRVCVAAVASNAELRRVVETGSVQALHGTTGEVLIAGTSDDEVDALAKRLELSAAAAKRLRKRVQEIRAAGFAAVANERLGIAAISAPVGRGGRVAAALSVSGPLSRLSLEAAEELAPEVIAVAEEIGKLVTG